MSDPVVDALLPPAILAILALALLIVGRRRAAGLALVALILFAVVGVPHLLITPLLLKRGAPPASPPGAIVVLASGLPDYLDTSRTAPSMETLKRLRTAAGLARATATPILVSGARETDGPVPVATLMAQSLESDFGVHVTWTETTSANLWQSAAATAAILRAAGLKEIYLVAQPWEMRLLTDVFQSAGLAVTPAPVPHGKQRALELSALVVITPAWLDSALALRQWAGLTCQALAPCVAWMRRQADYTGSQLNTSALRSSGTIDARNAGAP